MEPKKCYICDKPLSNEEIFVLNCDDESFYLCEQHYKASNRLFAHIDKRKEELKDKVCCKNYDKNCEFDGVWLCQNPDCKTQVLTSTLPGARPSGCPKVDSWNSKGLKLPCDCCGKETETLFKIPRYEVGTSDIKVSNAEKQQLCAECAKSLCDFINGFSKCSCGTKEE